MSDDYSIKNWKPSITATRAGGMDFQKVQESCKWQEMIRHERAIEMENLMVPLRVWHKEGRLKKTALGNKLDKLVAETGGYSSGHGNSAADSKVWFPTMGLGPIVPKNVAAMEPNKFKEMTRTSDFGTRRFSATLGKMTELLKSADPTVPLPDPSLPSADGFAAMPGEPLTTKQLVARMKTMQSELSRVRDTRKKTEKTLKTLKKSSRRGGGSRTGSRTGSRSGSRSGSRRTQNSKSLSTIKLKIGSGTARSSASRSSQRSRRSGASQQSQGQAGRLIMPTTSRSQRSLSSTTPTPSVTSETPSVSSLTPSVASLLDEKIPLGYTQTVQTSTTTPSQHPLRETRRSQSYDGKTVHKYNKKLSLWEHHDLSLPKGKTMLNKRDTYHSNNISALFSDSTTPGRQVRSMARTTMAPAIDLMKMGLMDELSLKQLQLFQMDPRMRSNRVMSPLTRFAEHAVKNRLKPFAVGRG